MEPQPLLQKKSVIELVHLESDDHSAIDQNIRLKSLNAANSDLTAFNCIEMIENVKTKKES